MPNIPNNYVLRDWKQVAKDYDAVTFNFNTTGQYLPLIWWDYTSTNYPRTVFGQPDYVGFPGETTGAGSYHDALVTMGAVVSASLVGIDKSNQNGYDFALMEQSYYNKANGQDLVLVYSNLQAGNTDFFYDLIPHILFYQLVSFYPQVDLDVTGSLTTSIMGTTAYKWYQASYAMGGDTGTPNYNHTTFDFSVNSATNNGSYTEPDSAAAIAWLEYMAYAKLSTSSDTSNFLQAADWGMQYLNSITFNPDYDIFLPYGAYIAARMNAELGRSYSVDTLINWCFDASDVRGSDWSISTGNWGGYDVNGLAAGMSDGGGYAFALETYHWAGALVPLVRYDDRYARGIGKWMLNLANSCRYFYANALDSTHQSCASWQYLYDTSNCLSYEALHHTFNPGGGNESPYIHGDALRYGWASTDIALYGGGHVGILGAIISTTNITGILQLNCIATDYYHNTAYPTWLYYNPYNFVTTVQIDVGGVTKDLYEVTNHTFLETGVNGLTSVSIPADSAFLIVVAPAGGVQAQNGKKLLINDVIVDYNAYPLDITDWRRY